MDNLPKSTTGSSPTADQNWIAIRVASSLGENFLTMDDGAKRMILTDWVSDLERYPKHIIEQAFTDHRRSSTFPPKPAEIIKLASSRLSMEREADGEGSLTPQRLEMTKAWLGNHETIGSHMRHWAPFVVPALLREGYPAKRLWDAGFRTDQLRDMVAVKRTSAEAE